jgi:hypothetical protein
VLVGALIAFVLGIGLGLRYSMLALVPAVFGILSIHVLAPALGAWELVGSTILCAASVQGGYMVGLTGRDVARQAVAILAGFRGARS